MERRRKHQMWFNLVMVVLCMVGIGVIAYISHRMHTSSPPQQLPDEYYNITEYRKKWQEVKSRTNNTTLNYEDSQRNRTK